MFLLIIIIIIHEIGHLLIASFFKIKTSEIYIYPFGGITTYYELYNIRMYKELLILLGGPLLQIIFFFIVYILYNNGFVVSKTFYIFKTINILLLSFNFLPIIPLDGSKLLNLIFNKFFSFKKSMNLSILFSIITLLLIMFMKKNMLIIIISLILLKEIINNIKEKNIIFNKFLLERYLYYFDFKKGKDIKRIEDIKRDKKHNIIKDNKIMTEKDFLRNYFDKYEKL